MSIASEIGDWFKERKKKVENQGAKTKTETPKNEPVKMKTPVDLLFSLGNKLSPERRMDFTYYLLWILFTAFVGMFAANLWKVINGDWYSLIWCAVGFAISALQYFNLGQMHKMRKLQKQTKVTPTEEIESVDDMMSGFKEMKGGKDV